MSFNEDQARDERGRFASGGNGGKSAREMRAERTVRKMGRDAPQHATHGRHRRVDINRAVSESNRGKQWPGY